MTRRSPLEVARELEEKNAREASGQVETSTSLEGISSPVLSQARELAASVAKNRYALLAEAERIILKTLAESPKIPSWHGQIRNLFSAEELAVFDTLNMSTGQLFGEVLRLETVRQWQSKAGTCAERESARERSRQAEATLADEGAQAQQQIAQLQQRLAQLTRDKNDASSAVDHFNAAVARLRGQLPPHAKERQQRLEFQIGPQRVAHHEVENRVGMIKNLLKIDITVHDGRKEAHTYAMQHRPEAVGDPSDNPPWLKDHAWLTWMSELKDELPALEAERTELSSSICEREALVTACQDFYLQ